jgi:hypothetical protein
LGWAIDPSTPESPVQVRLMAGSQFIGEAVANRFDDARVHSLVGPGIGGFTARLLHAPLSYPCQISLHDQSGLLLGVPLLVNQRSDLAALIGPKSTATLEGHVDGLFEGAVMGWARDTALPDQALELELLDGGAPAGRTVADRLREDLRQAGLHRGLYGYRFDLPVSLLDGRTHSLTVRFAGTETLLQGGPITFGPTSTTALLTQLAVLQSEVATLREQVDALIAPEGSLQRSIMRVLAERLAAQAEIGREQLDRDLVALRMMVFQVAEASRMTSAAPEQYASRPGKRSRS